MTEYSASTTVTPHNRRGILVIGTAHVSQKSIDEVNEIIEKVRPDIVAIELCQARYRALRGEEETREIPVRELLSGDKFYHFMIHWLLSYVQKKIGTEMGVEPGTEMLSAIEKAEEIGAQIALVDRDIQITLQRFWSKMKLFEKIKMIFALITATLGIGGGEKIDVENITEGDMVTQLVEELRRYTPSAAEVLIDERDAYIAKNLIELSQQGCVVAVVGAGHRAGIQKYLEDPRELPNIETLTTVERKRFNILKITTTLMIGIAILLLASMILFGEISPATMITALAYLFITQGILSATGVIIARGHPLSALTAFSLAWFGFINPFLAIGWIAGLVEAYFRPPTHDDFKNLTHAENFKELMQNKLFRIILVAALANIGSMLGTFVAIPLLVSYLHIPNPLDIIKIAIKNTMNLLCCLISPK
ncbi:MAG: TraB family protein [Candidatus Methanoperedenaceae archaeon GB50]|nr:MAG: TraB family protein [Candidatus Methanoperedenaceae archaeon GB50]